MAVSVSIENLYNWVTSQPLNTVDTPYVLNITWSSRTQKINNLPIDEYDLRRALDESYVYLDLSATTLPAWSTYIGIFFSWSGCLFQNLKALIKTPNFPSNGCTNWSGLFSGCTNLKVVSNIPSNIQVMDSAFSGCTSLTDVPAIPDTVYDLRYTFKNCTSLENAPSIGSGVQTMERTFEGCTSLTNLSSFNSVVTNLLYTFKNCTSLTNVPVYFVANAITLEGTFSGCSSLDWNIILPPTVTSVKEAFKGTATHNILNIFSLTTNLTNIQSVFEDCQNLSQLAVIPRTVTQMSYAFKNTNITVARLYVNVNDCPQMCEAFANCSNLTYVETNLPIEFFYGNNVVSYLQDVFSGCSSLRQIAIKTISEADWHVFSLKFGQNDVQGTVYDKNRNKTAIPKTSITKSTLRLPILTDEVWFPAGLTDSEIDDTILDMLETKYGVYKKTVIPPNQKNFLLWADEDEQHQTHVVSNILNGGGGGADISVYPTLVDAEADLANLNVGDFIATEQGGDGITDAVTDGDARAVTSNAVYDFSKWVDISSQVTVAEVSSSGSYTISKKKFYMSGNLVKCTLAVVFNYSGSGGSNPLKLRITSPLFTTEEDLSRVYSPSYYGTYIWTIGMNVYSGETNVITFRPNYSFASGHDATFTAIIPVIRT